MQKLCQVRRQSDIIRLSLPDMKVILLLCFAHLVGQHRQNISLAWLFDGTNFIIKLDDNAMELDFNPRHLLPYTNEGCKLDYKSFVIIVNGLDHKNPS